MTFAGMLHMMRKHGIEIGNYTTTRLCMNGWATTKVDPTDPYSDYFIGNSRMTDYNIVTPPSPSTNNAIPIRSCFEVSKGEFTPVCDRLLYYKELYRCRFAYDLRAELNAARAMVKSDLQVLDVLGDFD